MSELISLTELNFAQIVLGLVIIVTALKYLLELIDWILKRFGIEMKGNREKKEDHILVEKVSEHQEEIDKKLEKLITIVDGLVEKVDKIDTRSKNAEVASKESLGDRIGQKYSYYINVSRGIPSDEVDEFVNLHTAYKLVGGNHSGDAKFNYCMNHLPILPPSAELTFDEK